MFGVFSNGYQDAQAGYYVVARMFEYLLGIITKIFWVFDVLEGC